jgi:hypothetical protein
VDAIRRHDIDARQTAPGEKLAEALKMMRFGIRLKRSAFVASHPSADEAESEAMLEAWVETNG